MSREEAVEYLKRADITVGQTIKTKTAEALEMAIELLQTESYEDLKDALHIAQTDRDKWVARAKKLAKILGIRDCDIDQYKQEPCEDCISRQAAIDLCERFDGCVPYSVLSNYDMLPSVTPRQAPFEEREKGECPFYAG